MRSCCRVATVGVCGSDMHYYRHGRIGSQVVQFPWIVGHECSGTVEQVGTGVKTLRVGDRVAVDPLIACGRCDQCLLGRENTCRNQKFLGCPGQTPGAMAEQLVMPERNCFPIPPHMTFEQATLVEPFAIGLYASKLAQRRLAPISPFEIGACPVSADTIGDTRLFANDAKSRMSPGAPVAILVPGRSV